MAFRDHLAQADVISDPVSVELGIRRLSMQRGDIPLIFDEIIEATGQRAAVNVLTRSALCQKWDCTPSELGAAMIEAQHHPVEPAHIDFTDARFNYLVSDDVDLTTIPVPWHFEEDRGRYMSASIIIAQYAGRRNLSFHRMYVRNPNTTVARIVPRHLCEMVEEARANGDEVPIAVVNAPDPTVLLAAAMSFENHIDELEIAAHLHQRLVGSELEVCIAPNGITVPADAEYVWLGSITLDDDLEGPYVDITGTLDAERMQPVIRFDSQYHRESPIFHALISSGAEHRTLMGLPRAPIIQNAVNAVCPCHDVSLTAGGSGWLSVVIQITPHRPSDGHDAVMAAFAAHTSVKQVIAVDQDIDPEDPVAVEWALMTRWQPAKDTIILENQRGSSLDPSCNSDGTTSKIGKDATIPLGVDRSPFERVT